MRCHAASAGDGPCLRVIFLLLVACSGLPQAALALQATPAAFVSAVSCHVTPRSTSEILTLAEANSSQAEPILEFPTGEPADPATTVAITSVLDEMAACLTAGDMLRFYALHSDDWLRRSLGVVKGMAVQTISIPTLDDGNHARYLGPWHVQTLADGRVLAAVLLSSEPIFGRIPIAQQSCSSSTVMGAGWWTRRLRRYACRTARSRSRSPR